MLTAFNCAKRAGRWEGPNPAKEVQRRRAPKGKPEFLRLREVPLVLQAVSKRWQPLFATAIYTGLRKGELLGLCKSDVDFSTGLITVPMPEENDKPSLPLSHYVSWSQLLKRHSTSTRSARAARARCASSP